jgi:hypothetical protein
VLPECKLGGTPELKDRPVETEAEAVAAACRILIAWCKVQEKRELKNKKHKEQARRLREWAEMVLEDGAESAA